MLRDRCEEAYQTAIVKWTFCHLIHVWKQLTSIKSWSIFHVHKIINYNFMIIISNHIIIWQMFNLCFSKRTSCGCYYLNSLQILNILEVFCWQNNITRGRYILAVNGEFLSFSPQLLLTWKKCLSPCLQSISRPS